MLHPNGPRGPRPPAPHVAAAVQACLPKRPGVAQTKPAGGSPAQALHVRAAVERGRGNAPQPAPPAPKPAVPVQASPAPGARPVAPHVRQAVQTVQAKAALPVRPPAAHVQACLQRKPAVNPARRPSPPCLQLYNIGEVYDKYEERGKLQEDYQRPEKGALHDLQIIHETLNDKGSVNQYFAQVDNYINLEVSYNNVTPMAALSQKLRKDLGVTKILRLYETVPSDTGFVKLLGESSTEEPALFQDISAGLFHGEYEHLLQLAIVKEMYADKEKYGLKKSFKEVWDAMVSSKHVVKVNEKTDLSLWSIVMDIQGHFISGQNRAKAGINPLFGGEDQYDGIYGTSATLLHHGFGAWEKGNYSSQDVKPGELARRYPHLAEAIVTRNLKREQEAGYGTNKIESFPNFYKGIAHSDEVKEERKKAARKTLTETYGVVFSTEYKDYKIKPSKKMHSGLVGRQNSWK